MVKVVKQLTMATSSGAVAGDGEAKPVGGGQSTAVAVGAGKVSFDSVKWNPFSSSDWDNEKHTKEALVRIKRYSVYLAWGRG